MGGSQTGDHRRGGGVEEVVVVPGAEVGVHEDRDVRQVGVVVVVDDVGQVDHGFVALVKGDGVVVSWVGGGDVAGGVDVDGVDGQREGGVGFCELVGPEGDFFGESGEDEGACYIIRGSCCRRRGGYSRRRMRRRRGSAII